MICYKTQVRFPTVHKCDEYLSDLKWGKGYKYSCLRGIYHTARHLQSHCMMNTPIDTADIK